MHPGTILAATAAVVALAALAIGQRRRRRRPAVVVDPQRLVEIVRELRAAGSIEALCRLRDELPAPLPPTVRDATGVAIARLIDNLRVQLAAPMTRSADAFSWECQLVADVVRKFPGDEPCFLVLLDELRTVLVAPGVPLASRGLPRLEALLRSPSLRSVRRS